HLGPPDVDQGLDLSAESRLDPSQRIDPSAPDKGDEHGLRLIIEGVAFRQALGPGLAPDLGRVDHAPPTSPRLDRVPVLRLDLADAQIEVQRQPARPPPDVRRLLPRVPAPTTVDR